MAAMELALALETAIDAARAAGRLLLADFHRAGGPRGAVDKADADTEAMEEMRHGLRQWLEGVRREFDPAPEADW